MLNMRHKSVITILALLLLCTCIDPYSPKLTGYASVLVVDGLITDANTSYTVKLSKAFQDQNSTRSGVSDASVSISDDSENNNLLINKGNGIYKTDSLTFKGIPGRTYTLHIHTKEGEEYESDQCVMQSVPEIDNIYFSTDQKLITNGTESQDGISIYLDSKAGDDNQYYRWAYEETCEQFIKEPSDYPNSFMAPPPTWNDLYSMFCVTSDYYFVEPIFSSSAGGKKNISKMVFARPECANCELSGTRKKPDFWIDLN